MAEDNKNKSLLLLSKKKCISFLHLDLGIGGAEQLVLQLAHASRELGCEVQLWTTRCDAGTCVCVENNDDRMSTSMTT